MAVVVQQEYPGMSADQYDRIVEMLADTLPPGCLIHIASVIEGGMLVVDVWDSQEAFEQFAQGPLRSMSGSLSFTNQPVVKVSPAHHFLHT